MAQKFLAALARDSSGIDNKGSMIKTYSFNTDEDETTAVVNSPPVSNHDKVESIITPTIITPTISTPTINSFKKEENILKAINKFKKKKSRPKPERKNSAEDKHLVKQIPWYRKIDLSRPLMIMGTLIFLYLLWTERDKWIDRLLTSNTRIRHSILSKMEQRIKESSDSSKTTTTKSSEHLPPDFFDEEDSIENTETNIGGENNNEGSTSSSAKSSTPQKVNIRLRRNKMSFSKESHKKKYRQQSQDSPLDGNESDVYGEEEDIPIETTETILSPTANLEKKSQLDQSIIEDESSLVLESALNISNYDDIIEQLRKNLKSRSRDRDFLSKLSKTIGLNKDKLNRFIYKKDNQLMKLETFITLLNSFNLKLLIVSK